jgi:Bacteriocin-protection, YdeI or OmpD-Associated
MSLIQSLPEKLQLKDEKNLLIQGLPSSIEKQFIKFPFAKNVTPLLKARRIDFAVVFAISQKQLRDILRDVVPAMHPDAKLWVAYPKLASKIASDLCKECNWDFVCQYGYRSSDIVTLDHVWNAIQFKKHEGELLTTSEDEDGEMEVVTVRVVNVINRAVEIPGELQIALNKNKQAAAYYESLPFTHKREYVKWISQAKKGETKIRRAEKTLEMLSAGKRLVAVK